MIPTNEWIDQANTLLRERGFSDLSEDQARLLNEEMSHGATLPVALFWATNGDVDLTGVGVAVRESILPPLDILPPELPPDLPPLELPPPELPPVLDLDTLDPWPPGRSAPTLVPPPSDPLQDAWNTHALDVMARERRRPPGLQEAWDAHCAALCAPPEAPNTRTRARPAPTP